jgi:hypothetical protein
MSEQVTGADEIARRLERLAVEAPKELGDAIYQEALVIRKVSRDRTPVRFGVLKGTHEVSKPDIAKGNASVSITVGGPAAPYALYVHEDLQAHHDVGEAKFLEKSINEAIPNFAARIAARFDLNGVARP